MQTPHLTAISSIAILLLLAGGRGASAQEPPRSPADSLLLTYRPPRIVLVQPSGGAALQQDVPVVVLRYAAGDPTDPIDVRSFAISVDDRDRTSLFHVSATEAWGAITAEPAGLQLGNHELAARICSARGACSSTTATIAVTRPAVAAADTASAKVITKRRRLLDALLNALRTLLKE